MPPLLMAAYRGDSARLRELLDHGANPGERDNRGRTALHWAAIGGSMNTASLLLDRGADVDARADFGMTPLHWAALSGKAEVADLLLRHGADIRAREGQGMTPLHDAGSLEVVRVLLARGAAVDERDFRGMTPLHLARNSAIARTLLPAGADPLARATDGRRPVDTATGAEGEANGLVIYSGRSTARLRGESATLAVEVRNVSAQETGPLTFSAESPACDVRIMPPGVARLDPGELLPLWVSMARRPGPAEGEHPFQVTVLSRGQKLARIDMAVDTTRSETPEDRGMMRIGKVTLVPAPSRLQYLAFAAVPLFLGAVWAFRRRRRRSDLNVGPPSGSGE